MLKAFVISSAVIAAPPLSLPHVRRGPAGDVIVGDRSFIFKLLSTEGQSLMVRKVHSVTCILLWMWSTVSDVPTSNVIVLPVNIFTNIVNVDPRSAAMLVEGGQNVR